jgi:hypothetical protein
MSDARRGARIEAFLRYAGCEVRVPPDHPLRVIRKIVDVGVAGEVATGYGIIDQLLTVRPPIPGQHPAPSYHGDPLGKISLAIPEPQVSLVLVIKIAEQAGGGDVTGGGCDITSGIH